MMLNKKKSKYFISPFDRLVDDQRIIKAENNCQPSKFIQCSPHLNGDDCRENIETIQIVAYSKS